MRTFTVLAMSLLVACLAVGADLSSGSQVRGAYMEARTADVYTGACFANSEAEFAGKQAVMGWKIDSGSWHGVKLDGLGVVAVIRAEKTLGDYMATSNSAKTILIIDDRATAEQRTALTQFARHMGGSLLNDVIRVETRPITLTTANIHSRKASLVAGELAKIETRALEATDEICRHEEVWYQPLTKLDHAMPAFTVAHSFTGKGLGEIWSSPDKRSAFLGTFSVQD